MEVGDERFRLMADAVPQIVWITDAEGRVEFFNQQWTEYTGAPHESTTADEVAANHVHPDDAAATVAGFEKARCTGTTFLIEHRIRSAAGDYRWFLVRGEPSRDAQSGEIVCWFGASVDIHDRKLAEEALRESEARLDFLDRLGAKTASLADADAVLATTTRMLGEHLNLSVCAYADMDEDQDGFTIRGDWAAPGSRTIVGHYSLADFGKLAATKLSAGLPLVVNDNRRELAPEEAATFQAIGIAATICMPLVKQGSLTALMAIHDRQPRVWTEAEVSLLREVTARSWAHVERVAAIAELRESEARYRTLFESIESGFCVVEVDLDAPGNRIDYRVVEANDAFYAHTGFPETIANQWLREAAPALEEHWYETYGRVARTGVPERFEQGSDLLGRWFDVFAFRTGAPDGRRVGILFNDISARRKAEEQLRDLNDTLEQRVAARTAELEQAQEELRQSHKLDAMGQLTGGVAHDFNNLLTPIIGSLDMLVRRELGSERERRLIDGALQSAERARALVQRLLAFARRQPLQPISVDVKRLVGSMADLIGSTLGPKIDVRVDLPDDLPSAMADLNQLEMAVLNLAVNARDAMPDGGVLTISATPESVRSGQQSNLREGDYVRLSVADTGTGMDEATLTRAVEPFFSTKGIGKGTGLGLSMVHGLASQLDGALTIFSSPGQGTTVNLWLPVSLTSAEDEDDAIGGNARPTRIGTALLVDDEELVRMSTADMLMDLGYEVIEASSAEEALRLVAGGLLPDVVVSDHLMPGMTGAELARDLWSQRAELPVLIVSGYAEAKGMDSGIPHLTKPFRQSELAASLSGLRRP